MFISIHQKQFLKLIKACNGVRFTVQANQAIIGLKPIGIVAYIDNIIYFVARQVILLVTGLKLFDLLTVIDIESVTSADPHQSFVVLAQRSNRAVGHIFFVGNLLQIISTGCIHQQINTVE